MRSGERLLAPKLPKEVDSVAESPCVLVLRDRRRFRPSKSGTIVKLRAFVIVVRESRLWAQQLGLVKSYRWFALHIELLPLLCGKGEGDRTFLLEER